MQEQPQPDIAMTIITAASEGLSERLAKTEEGQKILDVVQQTLTEREVDPATTEKIVKIIAEDPVFILSQTNPVDGAKAFDLKDLIRRRDENNQLAQFLGLSLRAVMPLAELKASEMSDLVRESDSDAGRSTSRSINRHITRAHHALRELDASELNINALEDDSLDEDFQVLFSDDDED